MTIKTISNRVSMCHSILVQGGSCSRFAKADSALLYLGKLNYATTICGSGMITPAIYEVMSVGSAQIDLRKVCIYRITFTTQSRILAGVEYFIAHIHTAG